MIYIDGSFGEGGGQILRSALSLSMITGVPFTIDNIRAKRKNPGLQRQHLSCINAAEKISNAIVEGAELGSAKVIFNPDKINSGNYNFAIGTAGSSSLILQTILPALFNQKSASNIILEGGTHNNFAPPYDFIEKSFIKILNKLGFNIKTNIESYGFYPVGGGKFHVDIQIASKINKLNLLERGKLLSKKAVAMSANIPEIVNKKEIDLLKQKLNWNNDDITEIKVNSPGHGNAVIIIVEFENITEVFTGFGAKNITSLQVVNEAVTHYEAYKVCNAPVGTYLADQLLLPLALNNGGEYLATDISLHTKTNIEIIKKFLDVKIEINEINKCFHISIKK
jgi:RNA 3'-terminal phosphate cyclase (ATP)